MVPPLSLKGRPIIADQMSPTKNFSKLLDKILSSLVPRQESYIRVPFFVRSYAAMRRKESNLAGSKPSRKKKLEQDFCRHFFL